MYPGAVTLTRQILVAPAHQCVLHKMTARKQQLNGKLGMADVTGLGLSANPAINGKDVDSFLRTFLLGKNGFRSEKFRRPSR